jgi:hypothetical protein
MSGAAWNGTHGIKVETSFFFGINECLEDSDNYFLKSLGIQKCVPAH